MKKYINKKENYRINKQKQSINQSINKPMYFGSMAQMTLVGADALIGDNINQ